MLDRFPSRVVVCINDDSPGHATAVATVVVAQRDTGCHRGSDEFVGTLDDGGTHGYSQRTFPVLWASASITMSPLGAIPSLFLKKWMRRRSPTP